MISIYRLTSKKYEHFIYEFDKMMDYFSVKYDNHFLKQGDSEFEWLSSHDAHDA